MLNTLPVPAVEDEQCVDRRYFGCMVLEEGFGPNSSLLLAGKQDEGDGAFRLPSQRLQGPCCLQRGHSSGAVVERALAEVPRIEMSADDYAFFGVLAALDFSNRNGGGHRFVAESLLQVGFHGNRARLQ